MIETVCKNNLEELLPLFRAYQEFYKVAEICDKKIKYFYLNLASTILPAVSFSIVIAIKLLALLQSIFHLLLQLFPRLPFLTTSTHYLKCAAKELAESLLNTAEILQKKTMP